MTLSPFLPKEAVQQLKQLWLEGPEPPRISDNGWAGRTTNAQAEAEGIEDKVATEERKTEQSSKSGKVGEDREVEGLTVEKGGEEVERITGRF